MSSNAREDTDPTDAFGKSTFERPGACNWLSVLVVYCHMTDWYTAEAAMWSGCEIFSGGWHDDWYHEVSSSVGTSYDTGK